MFMTKFVLTRTPTPPTPLLSQVPRNSSPVSKVAFSGRVSPRLGQSDVVVPDLPGLHHQILDGNLRCKRACIEGNLDNPSHLVFTGTAVPVTLPRSVEHSIIAVSSFKKF
ncbi:hypothetical protein ANCCAN_20024 [Ancylostoma caninum]|uniref:Uncharacterized protein n=1 Tax=Ancylostoma caninum TaxID=29170 RepID=A0A368FPR9_ANCCA|nr:hypothetical protein ANCCAN_20024 [Ancylostoma caninum]